MALNLSFIKSTCVIHTLLQCLGNSNRVLRCLCVVIVTLLLTIIGTNDVQLHMKQNKLNKTFYNVKC